MLATFLLPFLGTQGQAWQDLLVTAVDEEGTRATERRQKVSSITGDAQRWLSFVDSLPWERGCLDQASYHSFLRAASLGVKPQEALHSVAVRIKEAGDHPLPSKLNQQIRRAYGFATGKERPAGYCQLPRAERPTFLSDYAQKFAERVPAEVDAAWLRRQSPVKVPWLLNRPSSFSASTRWEIRC